MRLIIRHCLVWGNIATQAIEIDEKADVSELQQKLAEKFHISPRKQLLKYNRDDITMKLIPGWPLSHYEITDRSILFLDDISMTQQVDDSALDQKKAKGGYFTKLGIMNKIDEEDEDDESITSPRKRTFGSPTLSDSGSGGGGSRSILGEEELQEVIKRKKFREDVEKLIKEAKGMSVDSLKGIIEQVSSNPDEKAAEIKKAVNTLGKAGWSALHFSIYMGNLDITKTLISYGADSNLESKDGWTPLQLSVYRNNQELTKYLLSINDTQINKCSLKGTALHIAAKNGRAEFISFLIDKGADILQKDERKMLPFEVAASEEVRKIIEICALKQRTAEEFKPPQPPLVKGFMYKRSEYLMKMNQRFFVMNPQEGTLVRYMKKSDFPDKPREIIPLKEIISVKRFYSGLGTSKDMSYIQLIYNKIYIFACNSEDAANKWVQYLIQGVVYSNYLDEKIKEEIQKASTEQSVVHEYIVHNKEEIEIMDEIKRDQPKQQNSRNGKTAPQASEERKGNGRSYSEIENDHIEGFMDDTVNFKSFQILKILGSGAFGKVYKVRRKADGKIYAMKALKKRNLILKNQLKYAVTEANVLKTCDHPFVLTLHYAFQTPQYLYLILDYCPGGDLSLHLAQKIVFEEDEVRFFIAELILAIEHIHAHDVVYRDLKPENILIGGDGHIKLADFGLSKEGVYEDDTARSFCGSPAYLSPEMLKNKGVGKAADIYGIGTVLHELLIGNSPYYNDDIPQMYHNIRKAKLTLPKDISREARDLIQKLLDRDPLKRPGVRDPSDLRNHPFFEGINWNQLLSKKTVPPQLDPIEDEELAVPMTTMYQNNIFTDVDYKESNKTLNRVKNFTFIRTG